MNQVTLGTQTEYSAMLRELVTLVDQMTEVQAQTLCIYAAGLLDGSAVMRARGGGESEGAEGR